jgi:hypothetical protein
MHHHKLESELKHLEMVLPHAANGPFPHSYWHRRIAALPAPGPVGSYHHRLERLKEVLRRIEETAGSSVPLTMAA